METQKQRLYLFVPDDSVIERRFATQTGAPTRVVTSVEDVYGIEQYDCIAVYTVSGGRFPSKHLRVHPDIAHAAHDGHPLPHDLAVALDGLPSRCIAMKHQSSVCDIAAALRLFHLQDDHGRWIGPRRTRRERRQKWYASRRARADELREMISAQ